MSKKNKYSTVVTKGIVEMNGFRYWFEYILAKKGDMCLATKDPMSYCNGYYAYSPKDPGNGKAFVIMETDDPCVYSTDPIVVEEERVVDSVVTEPLRDAVNAMKPPGTFGTSNDPDLINKWKPMLEAQGITDPYKQAWMAKCCENQVKFDKEQAKKGEKVIGDGVRALVGEEAAKKMDESLLFTEPGLRLPDLDNDREAIDAWDDIKIIESEEDAKLFCESIEHPTPPNNKLKEVVKKYKGEVVFKDPVKSELNEKPGFFRRILNWFKS